MVRQHEDSHLDIADPVRVVTEQPRHGVLPDLGQLLDGEAAGPASVLIPEPVPLPQVVELPPNDTGEGRPEESTGHRSLCYAGAEELQVLRGVVQPLEGCHRPVTDQTCHLVPGGDGF